jgi:hypothetical protein
MNFTYTDGGCTSDFTLDRMKAAAEAVRRISDNYKASRDYSLLQLRRQGYTAHALDRGHGEEWVLDDRLVDALQEQLPLLPEPGAFRFNGLFDATGIRIYRASEWEG